LIIDRLKDFELNPPRVLALGFASLILIGTLLLNLPMATSNNESIGLINAIFTAASAVCVTGLVVVNTAEFFSTFGQAIIIILIQIGGLGFMTMATLGALVVGKKISLKERLVIKEQLNQGSLSGLVKLTKYVIIVTFSIEAIGALLLSTRFVPIYGLGQGIWYSVFHAISAYCNAGFDILGNSFVPYANDITLNLTLSLLIILGGLGFSVYLDISKNRKFERFQLHTKLVIWITIILLLFGMIIFLIIEWKNPATIGNLSFGKKLLPAFFQSVVTRTAGFNSLDISMIKDTSAFLFIVFMFIGGSPGSTAGGIKTTTFGAIALTTVSIIKGDKDIVAFKKRIPDNVINRSLAIVTVAMALIIFVSFVLTVTEDAAFLEVLFETTSAFATVGLSRGMTPDLTDVGKIIITLTMYIGRVGPLTMAFAFAQKSKHTKLRYADGTIIVG
jgi:trk system potassium uptake protein TrkH